MAALRYIGPTRRVPTYVPHVQIRSMCTKFHHNSYKTKRLVCIATDRHTDR